VSSRRPESELPSDRENASLEELSARVLERYESALIRERLARFDGTRTRTAASLGISRKTLFNKMSRYGIDYQPSARAGARPFHHYGRFKSFPTK
jgi:DNA-binding NtrC family response regulator